MKHLICLFFLTLAQIVCGQEKPIREDVLLFEKGLLLQRLVSEELDLDGIIDSDSVEAKIELATDIKETILESALEYYEELIEEYPKSPLLFRALNNIGFIELALDDKDAAKETFLQILDSKANDKEGGGVGSGIMAEPYANYKNRASKVLAEMCIKDSNYTEAMKYLDLTKKYPYRHFCGNEYAAETIYMSKLYATCYVGLKNEQKALEILIPNLINDGLADNSDLVDLTYNTLLQHYSRDELRMKYEQAFKNTQFKKGKEDKYVIVFLDNNIEISSWQLDDFESGDWHKEIDRIYRESRFYRLVNE